jgi:hypothetical protein
MCEGRKENDVVGMSMGYSPIPLGETVLSIIDWFVYSFIHTFIHPVHLSTSRNRLATMVINVTHLFLSNNHHDDDAICRDVTCILPTK